MEEHISVTLVNPNFQRRGDEAFFLNLQPEFSDRFVWNAAHSNEPSFIAGNTSY